MFRKPVNLVLDGCFCLLMIFIVSCAPVEEVVTATAVSEVIGTETAVSTPIAAVPINTTRQATPTPTPAIPATPLPTTTPTAQSTVTPIPLPLLPMQPFPTVTPDYPFHETKPIFIFYGDIGGDGSIPFGRNTPSLVIYGDGQILKEVGDWQTRIVMESYLTPDEMCDLREQIVATGFMEPHNEEEYYIQRGGGEGASYVEIQVEDTFYSFYTPDLQYLVDDLSNGAGIIAKFQPEQPFAPHIPERLLLWIEEWTPDDQTMPIVWPDTLPPLAELLANADPYIVLLEGELVVPVFDLFSRQLSLHFFQDGEVTYGMLARPLMPHETYQNASKRLGPPRDYVPVLDCEDDSSLISPTIPTATPTLTADLAQLSGQGRILFVTDSDGDEEIFVMDADGTNRQRLTNNLADDSSPNWFPDGQHIVFVSDRDGDNEIYVMADDGTEVIQLTNNEVDDYSPTTSPNGDQIAFVSDRDGGWQLSEIYIMHRDGSQLLRVTNNDTADLDPIWSLDGRYILFMQEVEFNKIYKEVTANIESFEATEGTEELAYRSSYFRLRPVWSPSGTYFAWNERIDDTNSAIQILNAEKTLLQEATFSSRFLRSLDWSSDERFIIFTAQENSDLDEELYVLVIETGEIIQITNNQQDEFDASWWP